MNEEFEVGKIRGIQDFRTVREKNRTIFEVEGRAFLVVNKNTLEMRSDELLAKKLISEYESVMESRYFGRGGIEIVNVGQLTEAEVEDLVRLSYNLTKEHE